MRLLGIEEDNMEETVGSLELRKEQINPKSNPVNIYLDGLRPGPGRESQLTSLKRACRLLGLPDKPDRIKWEELRAHHLEEIKSKLIEKKQSQFTVNATFQALRGVAKTAYKLGLITREEFNQIFKVKTSWPGGPLQRGPDITTEDILRMIHLDLESGDSEIMGITKIRNNAICYLYALAGLRTSELVSLDLEDYISDEEGGIIQIRREGEIDHVIPITKGVDNVLKGWIKYRNFGPGPLFHGRYGERLTRQWACRIIQNLAKKHAIKCHPRALRNFFIRNFLRGEKFFGERIIDDVQKVSGHAQKLTTARYTQVRKPYRSYPGSGRKARY